MCFALLYVLTMGISFSKAYRKYSPCAMEAHKILICGLDASGKTTLLYRLKCPGEDIVQTIPTIGFNVETLRVDATEFTAWDVGGRDKVRCFMALAKHYPTVQCLTFPFKARALWRHYFSDVDAVVFVVDSSDTERLRSARDEFWRMRNEKELMNKPSLILCNKQDLPGALSPNEVAKEMGVEFCCYFDDDHYAIPESAKPILIQGCSVTQDVGLYEGLARLASALHAPTSNVFSSDISERTISTFNSLSDHQAYSQLNLNPCLQNFSVIKRSTQCPFAKAAKLWGAVLMGEVSGSQTIEEQGQAHAEALTEFTIRVANGERLDGFCIQLDDPSARTAEVESFGQVVRRMLTALSDADPAEENVMQLSSVEEKGWRFRFNRMDFFATTFAPCYPKTSSRYTFGCKHAFVLLQPEISFLLHNLPPDTPHTEWEEPLTIRDKTRVAFRNALRPYHIPSTTRYAMAEHIVKPLEDSGQSIVRWWIPRSFQTEADFVLLDRAP